MPPWVGYLSYQYYPSRSPCFPNRPLRHGLRPISDLTLAPTGNSGCHPACCWPTPPPRAHMFLICRCLFIPLSMLPSSSPMVNYTQNPFSLFLSPLTNSASYTTPPEAAFQSPPHAGMAFWGFQGCPQFVQNFPSLARPRPLPSP